MPITEVVELDISGALEQVATIGDALTAAGNQLGPSISDALSAADVVVPLQADPSALGGSIEAALADTPAVVTPTADTGTLVGEIDAAAAATEPVVTVQADTTQAEQAIGQLGDTAQQASGGIDAAKTSVAGFDAAAGLAGGSAGGLGSAVSGMGAGAAAGVAGVGALTAVTSEFFTSAVNAQGGTQRFNATFGTFADQVNNVQVGNLNTDLASLNLSLGSSTTQVRNALSSFGQLGTAAGASQEEIAASSTQLEALAARAVALNPALGSVGDAVQGLSTGLSRGGRFAAQYGIALTSAEINARALQDTGKKAATELTIYEKSAAGAALATEKYGATLKETIDQGTQNPIIKLRELSAEFAKAVTALGQPLVAPVFELLRSVQPILLQFASTFGALAQTVVPIVTTLLTALQPLVGILLGSFRDTIAALQPALQSLATAAVSVVQPVIAIIAALVPLIRPFADGLATVADFVGRFITALGPLPGVLLIATLAFKAFTLAMETNPVILIAAALVGLIGVIKEHNQVTEPAAVNQEQFRQALFGTAKTADETRAKLAELDTGAKAYLGTQSEFAKAGQTGNLLKLGEDAETITKQLNGGARGLEAFTAAGIRAGQLRIEIDGVNQSAQQVEKLNGQLSSMLANGKAQVVQGQELVTAANTEIGARENAAQAQLNQLVISGQLTQAQRDQAVATAQQNAATNSYTGALQIALAQQGQQEAQTAASTATLQGNADAWTALTIGVANGTITTANAAQAAALLGVDTDTATKAINDASTAVDSFVANALAKFPTATSVFNDMKNATSPLDPQSLTNNLNAATIAGLSFQSNIDTIAQKFPEVAKVLQEEGPKAAGAFADSFLKATPATQQALEDAIKANKGALGTISTDLKESIGGNVATATQLAGDMTKGFDSSLKFDQVTKDGIDKATNVFKDGGVVDPAKQASNKAGEDIGKELTAGLALGMANSNYIVQQAARDAVKAAKKAADEEAGIKSPSRLFAVTGDFLAQGLAAGLSEGTPAVVAEAEAIIAAANAAIKKDPIQAALANGAGQAPPPPLVVQADVSVLVTADGSVNPEAAQPIAAALQGLLTPQLTAAITAQVAAS